MKQKYRTPKGRLRSSKEDFYVRVVLMNKYEPSSRKLRCMIDRWYHAHRPKTCDDHRSALDTFLETNGPTLLFRLRRCSPSHPACIVHVQPKMRWKAAIETEETSGTTLLHPFSSSSLAFSSFTQKLENRKIFLTLPLIYVYSVLCSHKAIRFTSNWFRQLSKKDKKWRRRESLYYTSVMASTLYMLQTKLTGANLNANTDVLYSSNIHGMLCL